MRYLGLVLRGALIWLVPFVVSIFFYERSGELATSYAWFKSVMVVTLIWATLAVNLLRPPRDASPLLAACVYLLVNLALDAAVVLPLTGMTLAGYVEQIGLIYLAIPSLTYVLLRRRAPEVKVAGT